MPPFRRSAVRAALLVAVCGTTALPPAGLAQQVPSPSDWLGFTPGEDGRLADWEELTGWYAVLARSSSRVTLDTLGTTTRGRPLVMATITSPENHARLDLLHDTQAKLSDPRQVTGRAELEGLLERGRAVVLLTHGIHSTEVGGTLAAATIAHRLATSDEPETREILENVIVLQIPSLNPDGTQWVTDWYERWVGTRWEGAPLPWLYHFYVGHDNNRDWYAFTQEETRLVVQGAHNAWHPHVVHDIHQMGETGARMFVPPYVDPWEPNVDPALVTAVNQAGAFMAARLTAEGKPGVVTHALYDAWSPARAYSHYHGGARILSETASARLASPLELDPSALAPAREYDPRKASWNQPLPWPGGRWSLGDVVDYMESGAFALLTNVARNRRFWLENAWGIHRRAVEGWPAWPAAWVVPATAENLANRAGLDLLLRSLVLGDVEVHRAESAFTAGGIAFPEGSWVVPMAQPFASFAQTLLEIQRYPDLREYPGGPPRRPYDVTAHTLPLLTGVEAVAVEEPVRAELSAPVAAPELRFELSAALRGPAAPRVALYKSWAEPMEAGWTRWMLDRHGMAYDTLHDADVRRGRLEERYDVILLQSQAPEEIRRGLPGSLVPEPWAGGIGDEGARALRDFVRNGGRLIAVEDATALAVELLGLGVGSAVERLPPHEFYVPGSIVALEPEAHPLAAGLEGPLYGWFGPGSRAFELTDPTVDVVARYGEGNPLASGWILGPGYLAGRPAVVEARVGRGSVVLFGFQPNYRGQSTATWPLLFNAMTRPRGRATGDREPDHGGSLRRPLETR